MKPRIAAAKKATRTVTTGVITLGIVGTIALPAYAFAPGSNDQVFEQSAAAALAETDSQDVAVDEDAVGATITSDSYSVVTAAEIARAKAEAEAKARAAAEAAAAEVAAAEAAEAAEAQRLRSESTEEMTSYAAGYSGPSVDEYLSEPAYAAVDLGSVYSVASSYQGVPYVFGGATPAGFDCSGFIMYVYAQFGINMPHSASGQGAMGTPISEADAQPGDLVIMDGHDGFYAGNGMILHAPYEGTSVRVQPIWTGDYSIVRISG